MIAKETLEKYYTAYSEELVVYIYSFVRSNDTAEDILHDLFIKIIKYSENHEIDETHVRALLYKSAKNLCINYIQKNKRISSSPFDENINLVNPTSSIEEDVEKKELMERVHSLIDTRDETTRSIYYLKTEMNLTYQEIADRLGISLRTAKRKMSILLAFLADSLENEGFFKLYSFFLASFM